MNYLIYESPFARAELSADHPSSSYGIPVLLIDGRPFGAGDRLPSGLTAGELVEMFLRGGNPGGGTWGVLTSQAREAAGVFLGTAGVEGEES